MWSAPRGLFSAGAGQFGRWLGGGGRRGCHGHGGYGRRTVRRGAARGRPGASGQAGHPERRCLSPRPWRANVRGWRRRLWGGWSSQASTRPRRRGESDGQARGRAAERVVDGLRLARAATTCRRRAWDRQRVSPVVPPAGAEVVPAGTADRGDALGGVSAVTVPDCGGSRESAPAADKSAQAQSAHLAPSQLRHEEGPGDSHVEAAALSGDPI